MQMDDRVAISAKDRARGPKHQLAIEDMPRPVPRRPDSHLVGANIEVGDGSDH
jgi:hypothetical protein